MTEQQWTNQKKHRERGSALAEAAIALPLVLVLIAGIMQLGHAFLIKAHVDLAAARAARAAAAWAPVELEEEGLGQIRLGSERGEKGKRVRRAAVMTLIPVSPLLLKTLEMDAEAALGGLGIELDLQRCHGEGVVVDACRMVQRFAQAEVATTVRIGRRNVEAEDGVMWLNCREEPCTLPLSGDVIVGVQYKMPLFFPFVGRMLGEPNLLGLPRLTITSQAALPIETVGRPVAGVERCEW